MVRLSRSLVYSLGDGQVFTDLAGNHNTSAQQFKYTFDSTFPTIDISNVYSVILDGQTDLGYVVADEDVTWSISDGDGAFTPRLYHPLVLRN
ncbi:MAG: hypothetical protein CM15mP51_25230 [Porticoccaceae bacterium]|nr:MAG: hypothetical protein CM15mP51_25230 [Porticoccaceae bacterium]